MAMVIGYIAGIFLMPKYITQARALTICAVLGVIFSVCVLITDGYTSVWFIVLLGLANSLVWPAIWPLAIAGLGRFTKVGSSYLIMAVVGGALIPLLYGWLADRTDPQSAYWIMIPCYVFILFYAMAGYRFRK
jgi:fucose permease